MYKGPIIGYAAPTAKAVGIGVACLMAKGALLCVVEEDTTRYDKPCIRLTGVRSIEEYKEGEGHGIPQD